jgi:hypothetical protein
VDGVGEKGGRHHNVGNGPVLLRSDGDGALAAMDDGRG